MAKQTRGMLIAALGLLLGASAVSADISFKVGYVDVAQLFDQYERTKRSESILERKGKQKEGELEGRLNELKKLRSGLELLSEKARSGRAREIDTKADELRRFGKYTQEELQRERNRVAKDIIDDIQRTIQDYAKANDFSMILDQRLLLYGQEIHDVTHDVLKQLNAKDTARAKRSSGR